MLESHSSAQAARGPRGLFTITAAPLAAALIAFPALADPTLQISIGVRETFFNGGPMGPIGSDGGTTGGIEWINLDGQTLVLDGTWQLFTFNFLFDPVTAFAGVSANGVIEGTGGTLEHIRIRSTGTTPGKIILHIDELVNTTGILPPTPHLIQDWESFAPLDVVTFNTPRFSGSTNQNLMLTPNFAGVDNTVSYAGGKSYRLKFRFIDNDPSRWVRLTTAFVPNQPNPIIAFDQVSVVRFQMRGFATCAADLDENGSVGVSDLLMLLAAWGQNHGHDADFNGDGAVGVSDLLFLLSEWGPCTN